MARAPPSAVDPSLPPPPPPPRSGRKLINAMFRSNQQQQLQPGDLDPNNENGPGETDAEPDESRPANEPQSASLPNHEKPSPRKTIFPGGKNLINSMRNLSLRSKPKAAAGAADWEKQWDEDDEDSSEEEEVGPLHFQDPPVEEDAKLPAQTVPENQEVSVISSDDALEWDTAVQQNLEEKPDIQMFLPMLRVLGKGSFGKVVLVQKRTGKDRGGLYAMKILRKSHLVKRRQIERTKTERKVLSLVNHPFIMKLHFAFQSEDKLYLVLDYCPGGELFFHLSRFRRFPERVARFFAAELLLAIGHIHKRGIIFRDMKPENVLLDADGNVKLGDFGLAKCGIVHPLEGALSMCGTPEYMAPEVLAQAGHGFCVDYWGLGMILYEMMTGLPPWYTTDRAKLFRKLKSAPLDIPSYFSAQAASCVTGLLERDPRRRLGVLGIRSAMEHSFFRNVNWRALYARRVEPPIRPCEGWKSPESIRYNEEMGGQASVDDFAAIEEINACDLDAAVQNFENQFTRMPVESEDHGSQHQAEELAALSELNADTFRGFSYDGKEHPLEISNQDSSTSLDSSGPAHQVQPHTLD
ncbi:ribosomal protein S6 kinase alpha-1/2/3/6 [Fistulifera solaris]|uniref:Ribosomal protein S6 kinase alpha-1/2/3/6 n=1 Tax=Fistulifera solaris TaxID=1519565 RepID=A0A1Z5K8V1_FISSO|nr:ribosomal protein S6 kinase alpha-1/2/3/6 [Fistulifera solaris]|eukprot:GAX22565.1 ribosomal protein S6 kinase alpha-1/2/3/6 [Fistulifera solaris]